MKDKQKIRRIGALILSVLAVVLFIVLFVHIIQLELSLPPYSVETEGKHVAFGLELWAFSFSLPAIVSLFLLAHLIHPSRFEKFSLVIKAFSVLFAIIGFGIPILLAIFATINNGILYAFFAFLATTPFWLMGILAILSLKKDKFESIRKEYKILILLVVFLALAILIWLIINSLILVK